MHEALHISKIDNDNWSKMVMKDDALASPLILKKFSTNYYSSPWNIWQNEEEGWENKGLPP